MLLRLGDFLKEERHKAESVQATARGKMTFEQALKTYRERLKADVSLKDRSKEYREERIAGVLGQLRRFDAGVQDGGLDQVQRSVKPAQHLPRAVGFGADDHSVRTHEIGDGVVCRLVDEDDLFAPGVRTNTCPVFWSGGGNRLKR